MPPGSTFPLETAQPYKRKRIGAEFIAVFEDEARKLGDIPWLAQGTLYPDVSEAGVPVLGICYGMQTTASSPASLPRGRAG